MKIEKINEKQIKCTLNKTDLQSHQIKISELAYGTANAKELFRDMMEEAFDKFGFEADDIPLMIEAIPIPPDCIVLLITKVDNPDEFEKKMAKFAPSPDALVQGNNEDIFDGVGKLFPLMDEFSSEESTTEGNASGSSQVTVLDSNIAIYDFSSLDYVIRACRMLSSLEITGSTLYKADGLYYLVLRFSEEDKRYFPIIHHTMIEFGKECSFAPSIDSYLTEHGMTLIANQAILKLASV